MNTQERENSVDTICILIIRNGETGRGRREEKKNGRKVPRSLRGVPQTLPCSGGGLRFRGISDSLTSPEIQVMR